MFGLIGFILAAIAFPTAPIGSSAVNAARLEGTVPDTVRPLTASAPAVEAQGCPITAPNGATPAGAAESPSNHGTDSQMVRLWWPGGVIADSRSVRPDGSVAIKVGWWRGVPGVPVITGRRLDGPASPLVGGTAPPDAYPKTGFIPASLRFPTRGCWEVTGLLGADVLAFVVSVEVGRAIRPLPAARLGAPRVRGSVVFLRWRTNVTDGGLFDVTIRRAKGGWRLLKRRHGGTSMEIRLRDPGRYQVRVRPYDAFGAGDWSAPRTFIVRQASTTPSLR